MKLENATLYRTLERERRTCELLEDEYQGELASAAAAFAQALLQNSALRQRIVDLAVQNESLRSSQRAIVGSQLHSAEVNRPAPAASDSRPLHAPVDMAPAALLALIFAGACVLCLWCFRS